MRTIILFACRIVHYVLRHVVRIDEKVQKYMQALTIDCKKCNHTSLAARKNTDPFFSLIRVITHAGGGLQGINYLNCSEAMDFYYKKGNRVFEYDVQRSLDNEFVLAHSAVEKSKVDFLMEKIDCRFSPMTLEKVVDFLVEHEDVVVVLDCKFDKLTPVTEYLASRVPNCAKGQIVIQVFKEQDVIDIRSVCDFKILYVCMYDADYEMIASQCLKYNIGAVSISHKALQERIGWEIFLNANICVFAYTVNKIEDYEKLRDNGITGVFSDFLYTGDLKLINQSKPV